MKPSLPAAALVIAWLAGTAGLQAATPEPPVAPDPEGAAFFESRIRPLLAARCEECHGEKLQHGGLRLDSQPGWRAGCDSGAVIVPGDADASLLVEAVRYSDDGPQMPPDGELSAAEVELLVEWVRRGAPDTRLKPPGEGGGRRPMTLAEARDHWAFRPVTDPPIPAATPATGPHSVDRFIRTRLAAEGLPHSPPADPRTLVRRASLTLVGLPPAYEEVERVAAGPWPAAYESYVDELLARPEYGQRWGRHWLDVARYADTTDKSTDSERRIPFAHTYRDYVIEALNADTPFDRFVLEQIAADLLPAEEQPDLRALGFLTIGRRFEGNADAAQLVIDDRIDVIGRGLMGLTISCARCHDHKFDALPTADYYSLYGILASTTEPLDLPEVGDPSPAAGAAADTVREYREQRAELLAKHEEVTDKALASATRRIRQTATEYLRYVVEESPQHRTIEGSIPLGTPRGVLMRSGPGRWSAFIAASVDRGEKPFRLWPRLLALPLEGFAAAAAKLLEEAARHPEEHDPRVLAALAERQPASMLDVADVFGKLIETAAEADGHAEIAALIAAAGSPITFTRDAVAEDMLRAVNETQIVLWDEGAEAGGLRDKLRTLEATAPLDRAQAMTVSLRLVDPHVMPRGDFRRVGAQVPRRIPQILAAVDDRSFTDDGRLDLARAVASRCNPLTARVIVNRVWQHHFGTGLVASADNFGATGEPPSHPELLDHLAHWFMEHGWSLKALHRYLMASATWQQSSAAVSLTMERDPGNRLLWRMSPQRLEFEPLRDGILLVSGRLDTRLGGRSEPLDDTNFRRAVYGYTDRFRIPALQRNFDVASPDQSIARRSESIHPLQALFLMNSPFLWQQAEAVVALPAIAGGRTDERVVALYRRVLARNPAADEVELAKRYVAAAPQEKAWPLLAQALLCSNEFCYCD
ncbi:MAG: PSD1 and planctomycete cytochrome C domain-containing protein [Planctomycetia bacterium]